MNSNSFLWILHTWILWVTVAEGNDMHFQPLSAHSFNTSGDLTTNNTEKSLYIGGIFPMNGGWAGGQGCRPAVDLALKDVNTRADILPGYKLDMAAHDSEVSNICTYHKICNIRRIKSPNLDASCFVLRLSLCNILKPGVKSRTKM